MVILPLASLEAATSAAIAYFEALRACGSAEAYFAQHPKRLPADLTMMQTLGLDEYLHREEAWDRARQA
jgi:hypothetical protein